MDLTNTFFRHLVINSARISFRIELGVSAAIFISDGIGAASISKNHKNLFPIGYFQTHKSLINGDQIRQKPNLLLFKQNSRIEQLRRESLVKNPLIVHVRLGDYKTEASFGTLGSKYYELAIDSQLDDSNIKELWLFLTNLKLQFLEFLRSIFQLQR